jgi:hypothetical protein
MKSPDFISFLSDLIAHGKDLQYKNRYGALVAVKIQPLMKLDKVNSDPATVKKLSDLGVEDAIVIGNDENGIPIILATKTLKTYLLDPGITQSGEYLKNEISIKVS